MSESPSGSETRLALRVEGRVQGVGFRWWTTRQADGLGVRGTVCNLPDGSVEVQMAGPPAAVRELRERVAHGPRTARVDGVREVEVTLPEVVDGFRTVHR